MFARIKRKSGGATAYVEYVGVGQSFYALVPHGKWRNVCAPGLQTGNFAGKTDRETIAGVLRGLRQEMRKG
jgi:hypothetical protein